MYLIKLLLIGDCGVGKTSLLLRYNDDSFKAQQRSTIGVDYKAKDIDLNGQTVRVQIWDTAGQERFRSMTSTFYSRAQGIILVFDVTIEESFLNLSRWIREIRDEAPDNCVVALCANKTDTDKGQWKVSKERFSQFAADEKIPVYEVSAATAANVSHMFACVASTVMEKVVLREEEQKRQAQDSIILSGHVEEALREGSAGGHSKRTESRVASPPPSGGCCF